MENKWVYAPQMKKAVFRCYFKRGYKRIIHFLVNIFGLQNKLNKRLEKKWG